MKMRKFNHLSLLAITYLAVNISYAGSEFEPSQQPLTVKVSAAPNLVITIDSSASMAKDSVRGLSGWKASAVGLGAFAFDQHKAMASIWGGGQVDVPYKLPWRPRKRFAGDLELVQYTDDDLYYEDRGYLYIKKDGFDLNPQKYPKGYDRISKSDLSWYHFRTVPEGRKQPCPDTEKNRNDPSCYTKKTIDIKNQPYLIPGYARWYAFYRTRLLVVKSATNLSFYNIPQDVRVVWQNLSDCQLFTACTPSLAPLTGYQRIKFYEWLNALKPKGVTPLSAAFADAGRFYTRKEAYVDTNPVTGNLEYLGCRKNYHIVFTDGERNDSPNRIEVDGGGKNGKVDVRDLVNKPMSFPDGTSYSGTEYPYQSGRQSLNSSLANIAFYYWSRNLASGVVENDTDKVTASYPYSKNYWDPRNDPATWPHMVNFAVSMAMDTQLQGYGSWTGVPIWIKKAYKPAFNFLHAKYEGKYVYQVNWPRTKYYELWHAAIVSRGDYFDIQDQDELKEAYSSIFRQLEVKANESSQAMTFFSSNRLGEDSSGYAFQTSFSTDKGWYGNLYGSNTKGGSWNLLSKLKSKGWSKRNINILGNNGKAVKFVWNNLTQKTKDYLNTNPDKKNIDNLGQARVDFIKGDSSNANGTRFYNRQEILGDIINSKPVFVQDARYLVSSINWDATEKQKYKDFQISNMSRTPYVYVGANDGMMHAIDAKTGEETFAYIPKAVVPYLNQLTSLEYENLHRFYVDGQMTVADVYVKNNWRTVLVGTLGAGGKGIYALDITDPKKITLLWDLDASDFESTKGKLGYTYSVPSIARFSDGKWKVIFGNGPASEGGIKNGYASLFVLDIDTGKIEREYVTKNQNVENGLSTPKIISLDNTGTASVAYAGDLQGNLWRFDLTDSSPKINTQPLYTANRNGRTQAITTAPLVTKHPEQDGYIVVFGTGRFFTVNDLAPDNKQDMYGIWDPLTTAAGISPSTVKDSDLLVQNISSSQWSGTFTLSQSPIKWAKWGVNGWVPSSAAPHKGWRISLNTKESVVYNPLKLGNAIIFQTLIPSKNQCVGGVDGRVYAFNPYNGGGLDYPIFERRTAISQGQYVSGLAIDGAGGLSLKMDPKPVICTAETCLNMRLGEIGRQTWRRVE